MSGLLRLLQALALAIRQSPLQLLRSVLGVLQPPLKLRYLGRVRIRLTTDEPAQWLTGQLRDGLEPIELYQHITIHVLVDQRARAADFSRKGAERLVAAGGDGRLKTPT